MHAPLGAGEPAPTQQNEAELFFGEVLERLKPVPEGHCSTAVCHLVGTARAFVPALHHLCEIAEVRAKPKSRLDAVVRDLGRAPQSFPIRELSRAQFRDAAQAGRKLTAAANGRRQILIDIGGYFAEALPDICREADVVGVVEDTENGLQRYEALAARGDLPCPVYSVARSPLKNAEDYLVGSAVVFSTEAVLRSLGRVLQGSTACVLGFGKIGRSVTARLEALGVTTTVCDRDPIRATEAASNGYRIAPTGVDAIKTSGIVVCATGSKALGAEELAALNPGAFVVSVTSSDDELDSAALAEYSSEFESEHVRRHEKDGRHFFVVNEGNAVNFIHGAELGPAILLVQAEVLAAVSAVANGRRGPGLWEVDHETRQTIASLWLRRFVWTSPSRSG